jgi:carbamoyl-phosphate synthase small subunit
MKAILMLEDGKSFGAEALGSSGERFGQACFNTAVVGYQEMITDPANAGKILILTYPLIGNYGTAQKFNESGYCLLAGLGIKEKSRIYSNWQAQESFDDFINKNSLMTLVGLDTRSIAVHLRNKGEMLGIISTTDFNTKSLLSKIEGFKKDKLVSFIAKTSVSKARVATSGKKKVAVLDLGVTNSFLRQLSSLGISATLMPYNTQAKDILKTKSCGLIISNGPEDDPALGEIAKNIKELIGKVPVLGISTGHLVLAQALGARITRLKCGHRGVNYPIRNPASYKGEISVQNHACVADVNSLSKIREVKITGYNLNDSSVEEIESKKLKILGVQYYVSCPGFKEAHPVLKRFLNLATKR